MSVATCPECGVEEAPWPQLPHYMLDVVDITTVDDTELGLKRYALRCQACGYAASFVAHKL